MMVEETESEEASSSISLFERSTLNEWEASIPAGEVSGDVNWSIPRRSFNQFWRLFGGKSLPETFVELVEQSLRWKVAFSSVHQSVAIQKDGTLEIWRDYCSVPVAKCRILDDDHPQWCKLQWSASGNLLLSARSCNAVDAFDATGGFCFTIPHTSSDSSFNPLNCVASIVSAPYKEDTMWSDKVWILQYDGTLRYYLAGRVSGYHPMSTVNVVPEGSAVTIASAMLPQVNAILIGSYDRSAQPASREFISMATRGIHVWRFIESEPYLEKFVLDQKDDNAPARKSSSAEKGSTSVRSSEEFVLQIVVSSSGDTAACLTSHGDVVAFRVPSLKVTKQWSVGDELTQLSRGRGETGCIRGIGWWSQQEIMLLYSTGFVGTVNFNSDGVTAAVEKNYSPRAQLICAAQGHVLLLEMNGLPESTGSQQQSILSYLHPLVSFPYSMIKLAGRAFVGAPLTSTESDASELAMVNCRYVLHNMKAITPRELFKKKLIANNYEEALSVAQTYCLSADRVYQEQWRRNPITVETIDNFLVKVTSRPWVIEECLSRLPETIDACKKLLQVGISLTDNLKNEKDIKWKEQECAARYRLISYRRILDDYEAMLAGGTGRSAQFDWRYYGAVRNLSLFEWALKLAKSADFLRLNVLLSRYGRQLFPIWLILLHNVPETVDFEDYGQLLAKCGGLPTWATKNGKMESDFIEETRFEKYVMPKKSDVDACLGGQQHLRNFILSSTASLTETEGVIRKWYEYRAIEIERMTSLPDLAENFLMKAAANGVKEHENLREDMGFLRVLNYESSLSTHISYERLKKTKLLDTMSLLLKEASKDVFLKRFEQWAVPFCLRCEQRNEATAKSLVWKYLVESSDESLKIPLLLFRSFNLKGDWWKEMIGLTSTDIIKMAAECLSCCSDSRQIDAGFQLLSYLPDVSELDENFGSEFVQSMENHLTALHLLSMYNITLSYKKLQSISSSEQDSSMLLKRLVRYGTSISPKLKSEKTIKEQSPAPRSWTTDDWKTLLKDMMKIARTVLPSIGEQRCHEIFLDGLLSSKSMDLISLASKFLVTSRDPSKTPKSKKDSELPNLSYDSAVALISQASELYVNEAVNASDESLEYARKCLSLLDNPPDALVQQLQFIDALPILEYFGIQEVPGRLKFYKNPSRLIEEIFVRKPNAYKEYEELSKLCKLLRIPVADRTEPKNLLSYCARRAMKEKDGAACVKFCQQLIGSNCGANWNVCWDACMELCTTPYFTADIRYQLLTFCLMHCDQDHLEDTLKSLQGLKVELLKKSFIEKGKPISGQTVAMWNQIKQQARISPVRSWRMDQIYLNLDQSVENESKPFNEQTASVLRFLRFIVLNEEKNVGLIDQVLTHVGAVTMSTHTHFSMILLLSIKNEETCDRALRMVPASPQSVEMALYVHIINIAMRLGRVGLEKLLAIQPVTLFKEVCTLPAMNRRLKEWSDTLNSCWQESALNNLPKDVDRARFLEDEQYRKETIIGVTLSANEAAYSQSLQLAEAYGISPWDVNIAHLEYLFTDSGLNATALSEIIKPRRLMSKTAERGEETYERLKRNIFPLLNGRDHQMLQLYYAAEAKLAPESDAANITAHRAVLKQMKQTAPDIDYKKLISDDEDSVELIKPYLNPENFSMFAKMVKKIPNKKISLDDIRDMYVKKVE